LTLLPLLLVLPNLPLLLPLPPALARRLPIRRRAVPAGAERTALLSFRLALALPLLALALAALAYSLPQTGVRDRIAIGVSDVRLYLAGNRAPTSLSVRLELWRGGLMLVREHPWV